MGKSVVSECTVYLLKGMSLSPTSQLSEFEKTKFFRFGPGADLYFSGDHNLSRENSYTHVKQEEKTLSWSLAEVGRKNIIHGFPGNRGNAQLVRLDVDEADPSGTLREKILSWCDEHDVVVRYFNLNEKNHRAYYGLDLGKLKLYFQARQGLERRIREQLNIKNLEVTGLVKCHRAPGTLGYETTWVHRPDNSWEKVIPSSYPSWLDYYGDITTNCLRNTGWCSGLSDLQTLDGKVVETSSRSRVNSHVKYSLDHWLSELDEDPSNPEWRLLLAAKLSGQTLSQAVQTVINHLPGISGTQGISIERSLLRAAVKIYERPRPERSFPISSSRSKIGSPREYIASERVLQELRDKYSQEITWLEKHVSEQLFKERPERHVRAVRSEAHQTVELLLHLIETHHFRQDRSLGYRDLKFDETMRGAVPLSRSVVRLLHTQISMPEARLSLLRKLNIVQKVIYQGYTHSRVGHRWCTHYRVNLPNVIELSSLENELGSLSVKNQVLKVQLSPLKSNLRPLERVFRRLLVYRKSSSFLPVVRFAKLFKREQFRREKQSFLNRRSRTFSRVLSPRAEFQSYLRLYPRRGDDSGD